MSKIVYKSPWNTEVDVPNWSLFREGMETSLGGFMQIFQANGKRRGKGSCLGESSKVWTSRKEPPASGPAWGLGYLQPEITLKALACPRCASAQRYPSTQHIYIKS